MSSLHNFYPSIYKRNQSRMTSIRECSKTLSIFIVPSVCIIMGIMILLLVAIHVRVADTRYGTSVNLVAIIISIIVLSIGSLMCIHDCCYYFKYRPTESNNHINMDNTDSEHISETIVKLENDISNNHKNNITNNTENKTENKTKNKEQTDDSYLQQLYFNIFLLKQNEKHEQDHETNHEPNHETNYGNYHDAIDYQNTHQNIHQNITPDHNSHSNYDDLNTFNHNIYHDHTNDTSFGD